MKKKVKELLIRAYTRFLLSNKEMKRWKQNNPHNNVNIIDLFGEASYDNVKVGKYTYGKICADFYRADDQLIIGNFVSIAGGVKFILGANHHMDTMMTYPLDVLIATTGTYEDALTKGNIIIEDDVWLGADVLVLSGVRIGKGAVIGARSVIAKDVPPYAVVVGNPAKIIRYRFSQDIIDKLLKINYSSFDDDFIKSNIKLFYTKLADDTTFINMIMNKHS